MCTWPDIASISAGPVPLYGIWAILTPAMVRNSSNAMWVELPWPAVPQSSIPGFALASASRSLTDLTGSEGCVRSRNGAWTTSEIGAKSLTGSYGRLL